MTVVLSRILHRAVGTVTPGGILLAMRGGETRIERAFGALDPDLGPNVSAGTIYDLASLTKALVTSSLCMRYLDAGRLDPAQPVKDWFPGFAGGGRETVTIAHLLGHAAGLPDWRPLFRLAPELVIPAILAEPLACAPGTNQIYSDLGYILLGGILQQIAGDSLDHAAQRELWAPLGLTDTGFRPLAGDNAQQRERAARCAPTEYCSWRQRRPRGEVHDENAAGLGGVAGHAGLFSTAKEVARIAGNLLDAFHGRPSLFSQAVVRQFWAPGASPGAGTRRLGWDSITPGIGRSSAGHYLSLESVGHLGFTGCSLWIDPQPEVVVVLLTNRVYYGRDATQDTIKGFRREVHDQVAPALGYRQRRDDAHPQ